MKKKTTLSTQVHFNINNGQLSNLVAGFLKTQGQGAGGR